MASILPIVPYLTMHTLSYGIMVGMRNAFRNRRDTDWEILRSVFCSEMGDVYLVMPDIATLVKAVGD